MLTLCLLLMMSCRQKDLIMPTVETEVDITFDWIHAGNARVEGMTLYLFPDGPFTQRWRFDLSGSEGGKIRVPTGRYKMIVVNNDLKNVSFSHVESYNKFSICAGFIDGDSVTSATGMIYCSNLPFVEIGNNHISYTDSFGEVSGSSDKKIVVAPDSLCTSYHIRIDSVAGIDRVRTVKAFLTGVARSVILVDRLHSEESCCMVTELQVDRDSPSSIVGSACALGSPDVANPEFQLIVVVRTAHGLYSKSFNITRQILNSNEPRNVNIFIRGLDIPSSDSSGEDGVGMEVGVDGWQTIEITYS